MEGKVTASLQLMIIRNCPKAIISAQRILPKKENSIKFYTYDADQEGEVTDIKNQNVKMPT